MERTYSPKLALAVLLLASGASAQEASQGKNGDPAEVQAFQERCQPAANASTQEAVPSPETPAADVRPDCDSLRTAAQEAARQRLEELCGEKGLDACQEDIERLGVIFSEEQLKELKDNIASAKAPRKGGLASTAKKAADKGFEGLRDAPASTLGLGGLNRFFDNAGGKQTPFVLVAPPAPAVQAALAPAAAPATGGKPAFLAQSRVDVRSVGPSPYMPGDRPLDIAAVPLPRKPSAHKDEPGLLESVMTFGGSVLGAANEAVGVTIQACAGGLTRQGGTALRFLGWMTEYGGKGVSWAGGRLGSKTLSSAGDWTSETGAKMSISGGRVVARGDALTLGSMARGVNDVGRVFTSLADPRYEALSITKGRFGEAVAGVVKHDLDPRDTEGLGADELAMRSHTDALLNAKIEQGSRLKNPAAKVLMQGTALGASWADKGSQAMLAAGAWGSVGGRLLQWAGLGNMAYGSGTQAAHDVGEFHNAPTPEAREAAAVKFVKDLGDAGVSIAAGRKARALEKAVEPKGAPPGAGPDATAAAMETLGIEPGATLADIKGAYRRRVKEWHTDLNPSPEAEAKIRDINAAMDVLEKAFAGSAGSVSPEPVSASQEASAARGAETAGRGGVLPPASEFVPMERPADVGAAAEEVFHGRPVRMAVAGYLKPPSAKESKQAYDFLKGLIPAIGADAVGMANSPVLAKGSVDHAITSVGQEFGVPLLYITSQRYLERTRAAGIPEGIDETSYRSSKKFVYGTPGEYSEAAAHASNSLLVIGGRDATIGDFVDAIKQGNRVSVVHNTDSSEAAWDASQGRSGNTPAYLAEQLKSFGTNKTLAHPATRGLDEGFLKEHWEDIQRLVQVVDVDDQSLASPATLEKIAAHLKPASDGGEAAGRETAGREAAARQEAAKRSIDQVVGRFFGRRTAPANGVSESTDPLSPLTDIGGLPTDGARRGAGIADFVRGFFGLGGTLDARAPETEAHSGDEVVTLVNEGAPVAVAKVYRTPQARENIVGELAGAALLNRVQPTLSRVVDTHGAFVAGPGQVLQVMEAAPGRDIYGALRAVGKANGAQARGRALAEARAEVESVARAVGEIHRLGRSGSASPDLARYDVESARRMAEQLRGRLPAELHADLEEQVGRLGASVLQSGAPGTVTHGDAHPGNFIVDGSRVTMIDVGSVHYSVDAEGRGVGNPASDVGRFVAAIRMNNDVKDLRLTQGELSGIEDSFISAYAKESGLPVGSLADDLAFYRLRLGMTAMLRDPANAERYAAALRSMLAGKKAEATEKTSGGDSLVSAGGGRSAATPSDPEIETRRRDGKLRTLALSLQGYVEQPHIAEAIDGALAGDHGNTLNPEVRARLAGGEKPSQVLLGLLQKAYAEPGDKMFRFEDLPRGVAGRKPYDEEAVLQSAAHSQEPTLDHLPTTMHEFIHLMGFGEERAHQLELALHDDIQSKLEAQGVNPDMTPKGDPDYVPGELARHRAKLKAAFGIGDAHARMRYLSAVYTEEALLKHPEDRLSYLNYLLTEQGTLPEYFLSRFPDDSLAVLMHQRGRMAGEPALAKEQAAIQGQIRQITKQMNLWPESPTRSEFDAYKAFEQRWAQGSNETLTPELSRTMQFLLRHPDYLPKEG